MKKMYLIGNAHIDPVWLWRKGEGMAEVLSTFRSALDRRNSRTMYLPARARITTSSSPKSIRK